MSLNLREMKSLILSRESTWLLSLAALFACLCAYYMPFLSDDALISFRYSQRVVAGQGLTWTPGERVEGYSDILWILIHAPFALVGLDLIPVTRVIGIGGALLGIAIVSLDPLSLRFRLGRMFAGAGYLALLVPLAVWAIGGLEHGFMSGVLVSSLALAERQFRIHVEGATVTASSRWTSPLALSLLLAALTLLRVDGILIAGLVCFGLSIAAFPHLSGLLLGLKVGIAPLVALASQQVFRVLYYGDWIPNTARAKVTVEDVRWEQGLSHVLQGVSATSVGIAIALMALILGGSRALRRCTPALCVTVGWLGYQVYVGGDIFPSFRQVLLGLAPLAHVAAVSATGWEPRQIRSQHLLGATLLIALHLWVQMQHPENQRGKMERWEWGGSSIGPLLKQAFSSQKPLLAVDAAGALPYWSGLDSLDLLGLNDRYLAQHRPSDFGKGGIGHELGDANYYLKREPDLFAFCGAVGNESPCFAHSKQMVRMSEFKKHYRTVRLEGLAPRRDEGAIHVRLDGSVGFATDANAITIPAYFLASPSSNLKATLQPNGKLGVTLVPGAVGIIERLRVPSGRWAIRVDQPDQLQVGVDCARTSARSSGSASVFENPRAGSVDILISVSDAGSVVNLSAVKLVRTDQLANLSCSPRAFIKAEDLGPALEGAHWRAPPAVPIPAGGMLQLQADIPEGAKSIVVSADGNDVLNMRVRKDDLESKWIVIPQQPGGGMRTRRVKLDDSVPRADDAIVQIRQIGGDGLASIRSLTFE